MAKRDAVDPVYRSWQELEACDLEFEKSTGERREWIDDLLAPREAFDWSLWLTESARQRTLWRRMIAAGAWIWAGIVVAVTELVEARD